MEKNKIRCIQFLRGIAAISVVLFHLLNIESKFLPKSRILGDPFNIKNPFNIGESGVDLFFVLSGFIMALITYKDWGCSNQIKFILKRISRIFPIYWIYTVITLMVLIMFPGIANKSQNGSFDLFASIFLFPSKTKPIVMVAWSLVFEFYFYLIFTLLIGYKKKVIVTFLSTWAIGLIFVNTFLSIPNHYFIKFLTSPFSIEFIFGVFSYIAYTILVNKIPNYLLFFTLSLSVIAVPFIYFGSYSDLLIRSLSLGLSYSVILLTLVILEARSRIKISNFFKALGDFSYSIYLSHLLLINGFAMLFKFIIKTDGIITNCIFITSELVFVVFFSYFSYNYVEKPLYDKLSRKIDSF